MDIYQNQYAPPAFGSQQYSNMDSLRLNDPVNYITTPAPLSNQKTDYFGQYGIPALAGMQAGSGQIAPTTSIAEAGASMGASILSGVLAGGMTGGPAGAVAGGIGAAAMSGVNAFFSVKNARKKAREQKKLIKMAEEARRRAEEKQDAWNRLQYAQGLTEYQDQRNDTLFKKKWDTYTQKIGIMNNFLANNSLLQDKFKSRFKGVGSANVA